MLFPSRSTSKGFGAHSLKKLRWNVLAMGSPVALGLGLLLLGRASQAGENQEAEEKSPLENAPLCGAWHRGSGDSQAIDLGKVEENYRRLKNDLGRSLERSVKNSFETVKGNFDSGLPACVSETRREPGRNPEVPAELRGRQLWFFSALEPARVRIPEEVRADEQALLFVLSTPKIGNLAELSKILGKHLYLAPRKLAEALGVRCANSRVVVSSDGGIVIHESR